MKGGERIKKTTLQDLTGQRFGKLVVIERAPSRPKSNGKYRTMWKCRCDCGREVEVAASKLKSGHTISCGRQGCKKNQHFEDLTGMRFGRLLVQERAEDYVRPSGNKDPQWKCICDCGNIVIKRSQYLKRSKSPSCGCWKSEITSQNKRIDLTGQRFGLLTVEGFAYVRHTEGGNNPIGCYNCICDCGNTKIVSANTLRSGYIKSCGCLKQSYGDYIIEQRLIETGTKYVKEYTFSDLLSEKGFHLRFDYALLRPEDGSLICLIEYQGEQHFVLQYESGRIVDGDFGRQQREITDKQKLD